MQKFLFLTAACICMLLSVASCSSDNNTDTIYMYEGAKSYPAYISTDLDTRITYSTVQVGVINTGDSDLVFVPSDFAIVKDGKTYKGIGFQSSTKISGSLADIKYIITLTNNYTINKDKAASVIVRFPIDDVENITACAVKGHSVAIK